MKNRRHSLEYVISLTVYFFSMFAVMAALYLADVVIRGK